MEHATPSLHRIAATLNTAHPIVLDTNVRPVDMIADASYDAFIGFAPFGPLPGGEWDFASVDLIVHEAGGFFTTLSGDVHTYNKPLPKNSGGLLVTPDPETHAIVQEAVLYELKTHRSEQ
jgi:3'-phosphoadenosine 5'-phosphosulfate (PAPS) 3'-phosphatase